MVTILCSQWGKALYFRLKPLHRRVQTQGGAGSAIYGLWTLIRRIGPQALGLAKHLDAILRINYAHISQGFHMLRFEDAPKKPVNLSLNAEVLAMARELDMNVSRTVDALLAQEVKRQYWARWQAQNLDAIASYNARIAQEGLPLDAYRSF
jgi:antitoxin CcdA